jgi:hypothetical protein
MNIDKLIAADDMHLAASAESLAAVQIIQRAFHRQGELLCRERSELLDDVTPQSRDAVFSLSIQIESLKFLDRLIEAAKQKGKEK